MLGRNARLKRCGPTTFVASWRSSDSGENASAVAFLASDDASYINGIELFVDGGMAQV
jgi:NAD(P)-dependent dehydrogenase (short-subunit alcohol dehydrogenase family)